MCVCGVCVVCVCVWYVCLCVYVCVFLYVYLAPSVYIQLHSSRHSIIFFHYTNCGHWLCTNVVLPKSVVITDLIDCFSTISLRCNIRRSLRSGLPTLAIGCGLQVVLGQLLRGSPSSTHSLSPLAMECW